MITVDTNVFVYLWDNDFPAKQGIAREVVDGAARLKAPIGLQVIGEAQNVLRRKLAQPPWVAAQNVRNLLIAFDTFVASEANAGEALSQMAAGRLSYWDALLLAAARDAGCTAMITEDLQDGATLLGVEVVNPFGADGLSLRARTLLPA